MHAAKEYALAMLYSLQTLSGTFLCWRLSKRQGHDAAEGISEVEKIV
jgi:hypothetical protein